MPGSAGDCATPPPAEGVLAAAAGATFRRVSLRHPMPRQAQHKRSCRRAGAGGGGVAVVVVHAALRAYLRPRWGVTKAGPGFESLPASLGGAGSSFLPGSIDTRRLSEDLGGDHWNS